MRKDNKLENMLEAVAMLPSFLGVVYSLPPNQLISSPLKLDQFIFILLIPVVIGFVRAFVGTVKKNNELLGGISAAFGGILIGISAGYGFLSLIVLFNWQNNPSIEHLEPLFVVLGVAAASAEGARRISMRDVTTLKKG